MSRLRLSAPRRPGGERGAAAVELALALPLVLVMLIGVVDLGRVLFTSIVVHDAVQEGALYAAYNPADAAGVRSRVVESGRSVGIRAESVRVSCATGSVDPHKIAVEVSHRVESLSPVPAVSLTGGVRVVSARVEGTILSAVPCMQEALR